LDKQFWIGLAAGGLFSFLASVAANLFHSNMVGFLDSRKATFQERRRKEVVQLHKILGELHSGARDKYSYMLRLVIGILSTFTLGITNLTGALVLTALSAREPLGEEFLSRDFV
jgi:hypothetical protein